MRVVAPLVILASLLASCGGGAPSAAAPVDSLATNGDAGALASAASPSDGGATAMTTTHADRATSFDEDLAFLNQHGKVIVLTDPDGGKVALSALYQGRVMTSAVAGGGRSLGWINRSFIEAGKTNTPFDNYGGEDRFWLGPEAGAFGLYFPEGKPFTFDNWQTPSALQSGAWTVKEETSDRVTFTQKMKLSNWRGTPFHVAVERTARLLTREDARKVLGIELGSTKGGAAKGGAAKGGAAKDGAAKDGLGFVAFETKNVIDNNHKVAWKKDTGLLSIWILAMFAPAADARVIIPFETNVPNGTEVVNDRYFGKIPAERLAVHEDKGYLTFTCDGKERGKIGLGPARAKNVLGSYSASAKLLTIVHYDGPTKGAPYVNSMWEQQKEPYKGDVVNSYNDGPPAPGKPPLGGFYEIETSSPASVADGKGASHLVHTHRTFHFVGEAALLEPIAKKVLGVSLAALDHEK